MKLRLVIPFAVLMISLAAAGCGGSSDSGGGGEDTLTLSVLQQPGAEVAADPINVVVKKFEKEHPDTEVRVNQIPTRQFESSLRLQVNSGRASDIIRTTPTYGDSSSARALADKGLLLDLSDQPWVEEIPPAIRQVTDTSDGETVSLPLESIAIGMFYDQKNFDKRGLSVPKTYEDVLALCKKMKSEGGMAIALSAEPSPQADSHLMGFMLAADTAYAENPELATERLSDETTFSDSAGWLRGMEQLQEMDEEGCFGDDPTGITTDQSRADFASGEALMIPGFNLFFRPSFEELNPDGDFRMFAFPAPEPADTRVLVGPITGLAISKSSDSPDLAKEFLELAAENDVAYAKADEAIPTINSGDGGTGLPAFASELAPYLEEDKTVLFLDALWPNPAVAEQYRSEMASVLSGQGEPADVMKAMDEAWTSPGE